MANMPALFISHGAPTLPLENSPARRFLENLGNELPRPKSILAVSAHWTTRRPTVSLARQPDTIHDFYGFPDALYRLRYPAPGAPELASRVAELLQSRELQVDVDETRGLDHGAWTPLILMYPQAEIPVAQLSVQPQLGAAHHWELGDVLRPLRDEGVLILASGSATHNLDELSNYPPGSPPAIWAARFGEWLAAALQERRDEELLAYRERAPDAVRNHPTEEHIVPLFVALGAATPRVPVKRLHSSYAYGVIGMDAYRFD
ncbi:MAG: DODA-type extradiol aromatic ring-opening family dioxygenase [Burkholderiales bacterium]